MAYLREGGYFPDYTVFFLIKPQIWFLWNLGKLKCTTTLYLITCECVSADQQDGEDEPMETGQFDDAEDM